MVKNTLEPVILNREKGGIFLIGDVEGVGGQKVVHVVAPWVEGAFSSDGKKAYTLAKGSVSPSDLHRPEEATPDISKPTFWVAAVREFKEETGINLARIFNPLNPAHQKIAENLRAVEFDFYPTVKVKQILQTPIYQGALPTNRGHPAPHSFFVVELEGIEHLAQHLKHSENNHTGSDKVERTAKKTARAKDLPKFKPLLGVLRTGEWNLGKGAPEQLFSESDSVLSKNDPNQEVDSATKLDKFFSNLPIKDKSKMKDQLDLIRAKMEREGVIGDGKGLKIGTKHLPLRYYQEGADIIPYELWIERMVEMGESNPLYRDIQFNPDCLNEAKDGIVTFTSYADVALGVGEMLDERRDVFEKKGFSSSHVSFGRVFADKDRMEAQVKALVEAVRQSGDQGMGKYQRVA